MIREDLRRYIEQEILPLYDAFDRGHRRDHAHQVIERSAQLAEAFDVDAEMVYAIAAYHDTGLKFGRENHHSDSARIVLADGALRRWFTPRSIYGRIVAEADRLIIPELIIRRTVQYSLANFPALDREGHWLRSQEHLHEKYDEGGYLRLWIEGSDNAERLERLRVIIADKKQLREIFDKIFDEEQNKKEPV